ncbi:MAG: ATP synthase F1 subunit delta [Nitrospirae bacterium]|nr:MAG: ATP synthase F1 subunit delta [Nitrospirota bacterium]
MARRFSCERTKTYLFVKNKSKRTRIVIKTAVARRYAQALFELLDASTIEPTREALTGLGQAIKDSVALRHVVASPAFGAEVKIAVLAELGSRLGCPPVGKTFLGQLVKKNRVGFLPEIAEAFAKLADASKGIQQITVSTAAALPPTEQDRISTRLREMLKRQIDVTFHTEARHLAGVQIHLGSTVIDSTVRGRLQAIQSLLTKE